MALCLAESLLECGGFDARDQVARYSRWQQQGHLSATGQCVGITAGTARALALAQWRRQAFSGSHDPEALDPEPLSRVTPAVMYFFADAGQRSEQAAQAARTTCQAPAVLDACRSLARALHAALAGRPGRADSRRACASRSRPRPYPVRRRPAGAPRAALGAALEALTHTDNFRDAVLAAANLGGNSDVVAAVTGALAGAHYTASAIPALWRNSLMKQGLIEGFADRLLAHALRRSRRLALFAAPAAEDTARRASAKLRFAVRSPKTRARTYVPDTRRRPPFIRRAPANPLPPRDTRGGASVGAPER